MALARYEGVAQDSAGNVIPSATVEVRRDQAGRPVVPLFSDRNGTVPMGNPITTNERGQFAFHVPGGVYYIRVFTGPSQAPFQEYTRRYQAVGTAAERDVEELASSLNSGMGIFGTFDGLELFTPEATNVGARVINDPDPALNGDYLYEGSAWLKQRNLPDTLARMEVTGGTPNAIEASISEGIDPAAVVMLLLTPESDNTGPVKVNGVDLLAFDGSQLEEGWLVADVPVLLFVNADGDYQLTSDVRYQIIAGEVYEARTEVIAARDKAEEWAENPEDVPVESGSFSAKHHAYKAEGFADLANNSSASAETSAIAAQGAKTDAQALYGDLAAVEQAKDDAQSFAWLADVAKGASIAASEASGNVKFYVTKALATSALGSLPDGQAVEVFVDESQDSQRVRYLKQGGALTNPLPLSTPVYSSRAAAVAALPNVAIGVNRIEFFGGTAPGNVVPQAVVRRSGATVIPDMPGWVPAGPDVPLVLFGADPLKAREWAKSLPTKRAISVDGVVTTSVPFEYDNSRNDTFRGPTDIGNFIDGGSGINYSGSGKSGTATVATNSNPAVFNWASHPFVNGDITWAIDAVGGTWASALSGGPWTISDVTANTFTLRNYLGIYFSGIGLGSLTSVRLRTPGAMGGFHFVGSFGQTIRGLVLRAMSGAETVVKIGAKDSLDGTAFSGSITKIEGVQIRPETGVGVAGIWAENHKFLDVANSWFAPDPANKPGLLIGGKRTDNLRTLLKGSVYSTLIRSSFFFSDLALQNAIGVNVMASQFDGNSAPVRLYTTEGGVAAGVHLDTLIFHNEGLTAGAGVPAIHQGLADQAGGTALASIPHTGSWNINGNVIIDWPIGVKIGAGNLSLSTNQFRGRQPGNVGVDIDPKARNVFIHPDNDFSAMSRAGNIPIRDRRYEPIAITAISQTNPVVVSYAGGALVANGDRPRLAGLAGIPQLNNREFIAQGATSNSFQLYTVDDAGVASAPVDGTAFSSYTSGGTWVLPYGWHRDNWYSQLFSVPRSDLIFDLELDQFTVVSAGTINLLNMFNVPIVGGNYEISWDAVVYMADAVGAPTTGTVRFDVTIGGVPYAQKSFKHSSANGDDRAISFNKKLHIPAIAATAGTTIRFRCVAPASISLRGRSSGSLGSTFCQIRKLP